MRYFCRFFLIIFILGFLANVAEGQTTACNAFPHDTIIVCPKDTPNYALTPSKTGSYLWSTGATTQTINIRNKGKYWVQIVTAPGDTCTDTLTIGVWGEGNKGNYQWYFGNTGLNFSGGTNPTVISTSQLNATAGSSSLSDPTGHILLYTDGNSIYNNTNSTISGTGLGGNTNLVESPLIIPSQEANNIYYTFAINSTNQLQYSTVDFSKNGGSGQVTSTTTVTSPVSSELAGVYDSAGGFWVATEQGTNLVAYHVTNTGVGTSAVSSSSGSTTPGTYLKFSDNGEMAAEIAGNDVIVYSFNKKTGAFTVEDTITNAKNPYALEFSQDGTKLYVTTGSSNHVYGYDVTGGNSLLVNKSRYLLTKDSSHGYYGIQVAPNGKIYIATGQDFLSSIDSPEADSSGINFNDDTLNLNAATPIGLPNFVSNYFTSSSLVIDYSGACSGSSTTLLGIAPDSTRLWQWTITPPGTTITYKPTSAASSEVDSIRNTYSSGIYTVSLVITYQCENTLQTIDTTGEIIIYQTPNPSLSSKVLCSANSYTLEAGGGYFAGSASLGSSPVSYSWVNATGTLLGSDSALTVDTSGKYYVLINNNGCSAIDSATITFYNLPTKFLGNNTSLCNGQTDTLGAPGINGVTTTWNAGTPINSDSIAVTTSGMYIATLKVNADPACTTKDSVKITFVPVPVVNLGNNQTVCTGAIETLNAQNPGFHYQWSTGDTSEIITVKNTGTYYVKVYLGNCFALDTVTINYETYPVLSLPSEDVYCSRDQKYVNLYGGQAASYLWLPGGQTTDSIQVNTAGLYILQAYSAVAKCKSTDSVNVEDICSPQLFVPAAFSPNGDSKNDIFQIFGNHILTYDMRIFDKWGELIFVSSDLTSSWDGSYKGQPVEQGVYTWKAIYTGESLDGTVSKVEEGNVTVLK